jgi:hypothetical protein
MARRGAFVKREPTFDAALKALESNFPGIRSAADDFVEALRIGGEDLPAQRVGPNQRNHRMDLPALGASGRGMFVVTWLVTPCEPDGKPTFTLVDIWRK